MPVTPIPLSNHSNTPSQAQPATGSGGIVPIPLTGYGTPLDLCTGSFAVQVLAAGGVVLTPAQNLIVPSLVTAASREIIRYCGRSFALTSYNEILTPEGGRQDRGEAASVKLSYFPIVDVTQVMCGRSTVVTISNADTSTNQVATVAFAISGDVEYQGLAYAGLNLTRVASGASSTSSLLFATYPTVQALVTAINALGNGWKAVVGTGTPNPALYPSADLVGAREPKDAFSPGACLDLFMQAASDYSIDRPTGIMRCFGRGGYGGGWGGDWGFAGDGFGGGLGGGGTLGWGAYRVTYTAGFATIPESVQMVTAEVVKGIISRIGLNPSLQSETTGKHTWAARQAIETLPDWARQTLTPYRDNWI